MLKLFFHADRREHRRCAVAIEARPKNREPPVPSSGQKVVYFVPRFVCFVCGSRETPKNILDVEPTKRNRGNVLLRNMS